MDRRERDESNGVVKNLMGYPRAFTNVDERPIVEPVLKFYVKGVPLACCYLGEALKLIVSSFLDERYRQCVV